MLNQHYNSLKRLDPYIEPLLTRVSETDKLGICCGTIQIESISSGCNKPEGDRFKLSIPYATQTLTWNVFFDSQCPEMGPDFIFNDENFLLDMSVDTLATKVPSLAKWNVKDKDALLNVLVELLACYKEYQVQLLQNQERLKLEYLMLITSLEMSPEDVEVMLLPVGSKPAEAKFLISLSIDVSQVQNRTCESENDIAILLVTFHGPNWNRIISHLYFSKSLEKILGWTYALELPICPIGKCLADYVPEVKTFIAEKIKSLAVCFEKRKRFISTVITLQPGAVLEYDLEYNSIAILLEKNDFMYVVHFRLSADFPTEKPMVLLQSLYHMTRERTVHYMEVDNYKYSSSWNPVQMVQTILTFIDEQVADVFKAESIELCS